MAVSEVVSAEITMPSTVVRVRSVAPDGRTVFFELPNGTLGSATSDNDPMDFNIGDVLLAGERTLTPAPDDLWRDDPWVGVVRLKNPDITVVDSGGKWHRLPTNTSVEYKVGNTVEASDSGGVVRVLNVSFPRPCGHRT